MKKIILVVAPHPDDETLGCGGTLIKHIQEGHNVHWVIFTSMTAERGFSMERMNERQGEIDRVAKAYAFNGVHQLNFPTMELDTVPKSLLVSALGDIVKRINAEILYVPYRNDAHSDHAAVFDAAAACAKTFRYPSIRSVRAYETLSETEFGIRPDDSGFRPNLFFDISDQLERKLEIMSFFAGELGVFPFPRSEVTMRAQAHLRGSQVGVNAAEGFMLLKEVR